MSESRTSFEMAREFHEALDLPVGHEPQRLVRDRERLRLTLIAEEVGELVAALIGRPDKAPALVETLTREFLACLPFARSADLAAVAKEACDVHVVVSGTLVEMGIPEDAVYREVHRSNMAKAGGPIREDGKAMKPEGWTPPDVEGAMRGATPGS